MREIKFRAWDKDKKRMFSNEGSEYDEFEYLMLNLDGRFSLYSNDDGGKSGLWEHEYGKPNERFIIMQFTGLKDKKGKEIFEGDIVRHKTIGCYVGEELSDDSIGIIVWAKHGFKYQKLEDIGKYDFEFGEDLICSEHYEVIGNIYENPELLAGCGEKKKQGY